MAKRRVTDIARERGLDPNEVARRLSEAGVALRGDTVDEAAAARALAGSRPASPAKKRPGAVPKKAPAPAPVHPQALVPPPVDPAHRTADGRPGRDGTNGSDRPQPRDGASRDGVRTNGAGRGATTGTRPAGAPSLRPGGPRPSTGGGAGPRIRTDSNMPHPSGLPPRPATPPPAGAIGGGPRTPTPGGAAAGKGRPQRGVPQGKRRRVVIDSQAARPQRERNQRGRGRDQRPEREEKVVVRPTGPVSVPSGVTVKEYAEKLGVSTAEIIKTMMGLGEFVTITQSLTDEAVELIGSEMEREVTILRVEDEAEETVVEDAADTLEPRAPVVTIMGHVDHGKTTLLDAIRQTSVAASEAGGITQHIGAYQVDVNDRKVTFLDTPGHEAFTAMRARGAKVGDVAVLVVAADDGVMPQTVEAIDHAKAADVSIVVAVNKIDRPEANPDRVRQELVAHGLQPEEWGGQTIFVNVSAKQQTGLDTLLEMLLLQADVLELRANPNAQASGPIIESRLDVGRGPVATMLVERGTLHTGDAIVAGDAWGKVRALQDYRGQKIDAATPAVPVEILGFDKPPPAGERARVVESDREARQIAQRRAARMRSEVLARRQKSISLEDLFAQMSEGALKELNLVIKADVQGSVEAAVSELEKIKHDEVAVRVIHTGVGGIGESDVMLAAASKAIVVGFNVRPNADAKLLSEREGVDVRTYRVIYQLTEDIQKALVGLLSPDIVEDIVGEAEVRATFRASRIGTIAGCMVTSGTISRNSRVRVIREGTVVWEGGISSLKRVKDDVREVSAGFECGIALDGFNDVKEGDVLEAFATRSVERTEL